MDLTILAYFMSRFLLILAPLLLLPFIALQVYAAGQGGWNLYESETGLYSVELPGNPVIQTNSMRVNPNYKVYSEEMLSTIDQREYKKSLKHYRVSITQTWGPGLKKTKEFYLERDLDRYLKSFALGDTELQDSGQDDHEDYIYYYVTFFDPKLGLQGVRTHVYYTNTMRIEQTVSGPNKIMTKAKTKKFFDSLSLKRGYTKTISHFEDWENNESVLGIFTMPLPFETSTYFPNKPVVASDRNSESLKMAFYDPVREQNMYYNIYAYRLNKKVTDVMAKQVLAKQHIRKYSPYQKNINFKILEKSGYPLIQHETIIRDPPAKIPYLNTIQLRAQYHGNILVVQELMGHHPLTRSNFAKYLMNLLEFTPERAIAWGNGEPYPPPEIGQEMEEEDTPSPQEGKNAPRD